MRFDKGNPNEKDIIERESSRPAFQALIYPGNSKRFEVATNAPPVFLLAGYNDDIATGIVDVYVKYKEAGVVD